MMKFVIALLAVVFLLVSFTTLMGLIREFSYYNELAVRAVPVEATVVKHYTIANKSSSTRKNSYQAVVSFTSPQGQPAEAIFVMAGSNEYPIGKTSTLYYDPVNPSQLHRDLKYFNYSPVAVITIFGILGLLMTGLAIALFKQNKTNFASASSHPFSV